MLLNDAHLRFGIEKSIICLIVGKAGLVEEEEEVVTKR
jgi:hypothetical protein